MRWLFDDRNKLKDMRVTDIVIESGEKIGNRPRAGLPPLLEAGLVQAEGAYTNRLLNTNSKLLKVHLEHSVDPSRPKSHLSLHDFIITAVQSRSEAESPPPRLSQALRPNSPAIETSRSPSPTRVKLPAGWKAYNEFGRETPIAVRVRDVPSSWVPVGSASDMPPLAARAQRNANETPSLSRGGTLPSTASAPRFRAGRLGSIESSVGAPGFRAGGITDRSAST